jgi:hypothetical protein
MRCFSLSFAKLEFRLPVRDETGVSSRGGKAREVGGELMEGIILIISIFIVIVIVLLS